MSSGGGGSISAPLSPKTPIALPPAVVAVSVSGSSHGINWPLSRRQAAFSRSRCARHLTARGAIESTPWPLGPGLRLSFAISFYLPSPGARYAWP
jgi:hypothetical protein